MQARLAADTCDLLDPQWPRAIGKQWLSSTGAGDDHTWHLADLEIGEDPRLGGPDREEPKWSIEDQKKRIWTLCRVGLHSDRLRRAAAPPLAERCGICLDFAKGRGRSG